MKIQIVKKTYGKKSLYKSLPYKACCKEGGFNDLIKIVVGPEVDEELAPVDKGMVVTVGIEKVYAGSDSGFIPSTTVYSPIHYCPYCGEKFEYEYVGEEDISEAVTSLEKASDQIRKAKEATDSLKEVKELNRKAEELFKQREALITSNVCVVEED